MPLIFVCDCQDFLSEFLQRINMSINITEQRLQNNYTNSK